MSHNSTTAFDLIIAGGGATGLALAAILIKHTELRIGLIEANSQQSFNDEQAAQTDFLELRSVALSAQSCEFLNQVGLTSLADIACPIHTIQVSDQGHIGRCTLRAQDYQMDALGRVVELPALVAKLYQITQHSGDQLHTFYQSTINEVERSQSEVRVTLSDGQLLTAGLLVVAEGGQSLTRQKLGIEVTVDEYQQTALVANVELASHHQHWAYERFTAQGPLALLPLNSLQPANKRHRCALVWTLSDQRYQQLIKMNDADFMQTLQREFGHRAGLIKRVGRRAGFPLALTFAQQHIHHRAVLIGNACQSLHPIAGQGLNLALRDVQQLADILIEHQHDDIGRFQLLHHYQQVRKTDQRRLTSATDTLVRTFSNDYFPLVMGRNLALLALDNLPSLKHAFAMTAMGYNSKKGQRHAKL